MRVLGLGQDEFDDAGMARLHRVPEDLNQRSLSPLFQDLDRLLTQIAQPIARVLDKYGRTGSNALAHLEYELAFFAAAAQMILKAQAAGINFCVPEVAASDERLTEISGLANIALVLTQPDRVVPSDANFDDEGRIAILTGPNSGGKTTYLRSIGLAQVLFQAGLLLPAKAARLSPIDKLFTHFPALETRQEGRLAEEAARLRKVFQEATAHSLVLMNETFSSTSSGEAIFLAQDVLCGLRAIGVRAIFATHLIELAGKIDPIEDTVAGDSALFSLVAGMTLGANGEETPTYHITRGQPQGQSYAREIARRHGISLEQILANREEKREDAKA
jgi:DNA mismatch repair ATPase MutS